MPQAGGGNGLSFEAAQLLIRGMLAGKEGFDGDDPVEADSALLIMTLGAAKGDTIEVSGENAEHVAAIAALVAKDLDA